MNTEDYIAITSRSFSKNSVLRDKILASYAHVKFNDAGIKLEDQQLIEFLKGHNKVIAGLEKFNDHTLNQLPKLEVISRFGVGVDGIDFTALEQHNVRLAVTPGVNKLAVAELTLSLMLMSIRQCFSAAHQLKTEKWQKIKGNQLSGKTIGIIGANYVGKEVIRLLAPFGCEILIYDIADLSSYCNESGCLQVTFNYLINHSDVISLHVPATSKTHHLINNTALNNMKKSAFLINTARGAVVDQHALKNALTTNQIAGAALDVFETEPVTDDELISLPNFIATPHIAGNTVESELAMGYAAISGLEDAKIPEYA